MFHGTKEPFSKVDMSRGAQGVFWLTSNLGALERGEVGANSSRTVLRCYVRMVNPAGWDEYDKYSLGELRGKGYDGVVLEDPDGTFDAIVFKPNQVKILPHLEAQEPVAVKAKLLQRKVLFSEQKTASAAVVQDPGFQSWFAGSKVVNSDGSPKPVYHGTGADIKNFSYDFTGKGNDQLGSGFYFTDSPDTASGYTARQQNDQPTPGGEQANVMRVYLSLKNPIIVGQTHRKFTAAQIQKIISAAPELEDKLWDFGDWQTDGKAKVMRDAVKLYMDAQTPEDTLHIIHMLANDFFRENVKEFNQVLKTVTGYDGVIRTMGADDVWSPNETHYVAWFPSQIRSAISGHDFEKAA